MTDSDRLQYAERELAELRAFFTLIHENERRLQEELARMRRTLEERSIEIGTLRNAALRVEGLTPADDPRDAEIARLKAELAAARASTADLEKRIAGLRAALAELRDERLTHLPSNLPVRG